MTYVCEMAYSKVFEDIDYVLSSIIIKYLNILIIRIYRL